MSESTDTPVATICEHEERLMREFSLRLTYLRRNFVLFTWLRGDRLDWNASLRAIARVQKRRVKRVPSRARLHLEIEVIITQWARELAAQRGATKCDEKDVEVAALRALRELKPRRGRPANDLLEYHVHGLMALWRQTCGEDIRVGAWLDCNSRPLILPPADRILPAIFYSADRRATAGAIARIIRLAHKSGVVKGKRFEDFFPLYGGDYDPETGAPTGGPGYRLKHFQPSEPIFVS